MRRLLALGVDGIISDFPDRLRTLAAEAGFGLPEPTPVMP
jgi:glycerophosphoryl diester phosphodiesterase